MENKALSSFDILVKGIGLQCWTYLLRSQNAVVIIDPGPDYAAKWVERALRKKQRIAPEDVNYALITHAHVDHCLGADYWQKRGIKLAGSAECSHLMNTADRGIWGEHPERVKPVQIDRVLTDGQQLEAGDLTIHCLSTPGHTRDGMSYVVNVNETRYAFTGDLIMPNGNPGWTGGADFSVDETLHSLAILQDMAPDIICTGHGVIAEDSSAWLKDVLKNGRSGNWRLLK